MRKLSFITVQIVFKNNFVVFINPHRKIQIRNNKFFKIKKIRYKLQYYTTQDTT